MALYILLLIAPLAHLWIYEFVTLLVLSHCIQSTMHSFRENVKYHCAYL